LNTIEYTIKVRYILAMIGIIFAINYKLNFVFNNYRFISKVQLIIYWQISKLITQERYPHKRSKSYVEEALKGLSVA
jgi:hypothetical protein